MWKRKANPSYLPEGAVAQLAAYGKGEWESAPSYEAVMAMSRLQTHPAVIAAPALATVELCRAALSQGGWSLYGAWTAVHAFIPSEVDTPVYCEAQDASIAFLRSQQFPRHVLEGRLRADVRMRWTELYGAL